MSISPNVPTPEESYHYESAGTPRWVAILFGLLFIGLGVVAYLGYSAQSRLDEAIAKQNKVLTAELEQANSRLADLKGNLEITQQKVGVTQAEIARAKSRAETIRKEQAAADERLNAQLSQVAKESNEKIDTEVGGVRKDLEATRTDLETTKGKLERTQGDMGVMSGLIAHNRDDLEELKRRGDRNYYEFTLNKGKTPHRVGPVQVTLSKADQKKSRYTMTVFVDDRSIEKKDKTVGEPVQFYVKGSSRMAPYEIVVFDVLKDKVTGYLATPKEGGAPAVSAKPQS